MKPKLVFMGTPEFAVPTLRHLAQAGYPLAAVVTQPDKPKGRGYAEAPPPVKQAALELGVKVIQPESVNVPEVIAELTAAAPDAIVVAAFGQILKPAVLAVPRWGCINLHASLLPKFRGAAPIQWAIARGETGTGVTVQKMAERVDTGAVLVQRTAPIGPDETAPELSARLAELGGPAVAEALDLLAASDGRAGAAQDDAQASLAPRLTREDGRLDWSLPAQALHDRVRAFTPWPGAFTRLQEQTLKVLATRRSDQPAPAGAAPGAIVSLHDETGWLVAAGQGTTLWVERVQCPNKSAMTAHAYACGYRVGVGDRLH